MVAYGAVCDTGATPGYNLLGGKDSVLDESDGSRGCSRPEQLPHRFRVSHFAVSLG